jgi:hypothetical protein
MVFGQRLQRGLVIGLAGATWIAGAATLRAAEGCALPTGGETKVVSVSEDGDIALADGRTAKLAFVDVPEGFAEAARASIVSTVGEAVRVIHIGASADRWGRILALISPSKSEAESGTQEASLGALLVRAGLARVKPEPMSGVESLDCFKALLASETVARRDGAGLWADTRYALKDAADTAGLLALTGSFAVFEGRVLSVGERRERTYLNFGKRWSEDTTVTIPQRVWSQLGSRGLTAKTLDGRRVRVRGTVESRDGPLVEVVTPDQIELVDGGR